MIKIFPTNKVKEMDQYTIDHEPVSSIELVERAAIAFTHEFCRHFSKQTRIFVFAGEGNNGADALAIARLLIEESYRVETFLFNPNEHLSTDNQFNKQRLEAVPNVTFNEIIKDFYTPKIEDKDIIIDGLFGSGLNRPLERGYAALVDFINKCKAKIVSIDIPSGLFGEDNRTNTMKSVIKADFTYTFNFPKLAFLLPENAPYVGQWTRLDINMHPDIVKKTETKYSLITENDISLAIRPRDRFAHKGTFGHALLVAGSRGKFGAALLAARSCLRSGAGLLTVHVPERAEQIFQSAFPEAMLSFDPHSDFFSSIPNLSPYNAVGIGPGIGQHPETASALDRLMSEYNKPMVIDADAINLIASNKDLFAKIPKRSILTPHPKEFDRIAGVSENSYDRLLKAQEMANTYKICIVLKGAYTATCSPEGNVYFNSCGNPGMATAGSGDVLTGIILGLLAQGYEPETAAVAGVYLHALAGDKAAKTRTQESMIASDITEMLGIAFKEIK
jgi:ADP-dependent NAD(P)H-hydrate dehydratase / NAD(P)H-hydrate epimerase